MLLRCILSCFNPHQKNALNNKIFVFIQKLQVITKIMIWASSSHSVNFISGGGRQVKFCNHDKADNRGWWMPLDVGHNNYNNNMYWGIVPKWSLHLIIQWVPKILITVQGGEHPPKTPSYIVLYPDECGWYIHFALYIVPGDYMCTEVYPTSLYSHMRSKLFLSHMNMQLQQMNALYGYLQDLRLQQL